MANGENRGKMRHSAENLGEGIKKVTLGLGKGIKDFAEGTVEGIIHPSTIPEKIETCFDRAIVKPTLRTVDFIDESAHTLMSETDKAFNEKVQRAQEGAAHLKVVFATPLEDLTGVSFTAKQYPKSAEDRDLIDAALKENFVFSHLTTHKRHGLIGAFEPMIVKKGTNIITEGDLGDYFYVLGTGEVTFKIGGIDVGTCAAGSSFGELALLYQAPRAATCVAKTQCGVFRLDQQAFRRILAQQMQNSRKEVLDILKKVSYFQDLDDEYLDKISNNLKLVTFNDGDVLVNKLEGSPRRFFIVKEGQIDVTGVKAGGAEYKDITITAGKYFGEFAIMNNEWAIGVAKARGRVTCLTLDRDQFIKVLGDDIGLLVRKTMDKRALVSMSMASYCCQLGAFCESIFCCC